MKDDVRKYIFGAVIVFVVGVLIWVGFVYTSSCGFTLACNRGTLPVERTSIPTLLPANMPAIERVSSSLVDRDCHHLVTPPATQLSNSPKPA